MSIESGIGRSVARLSAWIDGSYPADMNPELHLRRRIDKLMEEVGETGQALGGYTGENPRKGVTHSREDVMSELLDVAITALGAWEHMDGNRGRSGINLASKLLGVLARVGLYTTSHEFCQTEDDDRCSCGLPLDAHTEPID